MMNHSFSFVCAILVILLSSNLAVNVDEVGKIVPYITSSLPANHMSLKVTNHSINHEIALSVTPNVCMTSSYGAYYGSWIVCRADANSAWISANNEGIYEPVQICNYLGFASVTANGGTCGTVCGYCGNGGSGCGTTSNAGYFFDGQNGCVFPQLCYTVQWLCGNPTSSPTNKPSTVRPTNKPSTVRPTNKPSTARPTNKPSTARPTRKPSTVGQTSEPSTKSPTSKCGGNCPASCESCPCGTSKSIQSVETWCAKHTWNQSNCQCIMSEESGANANAVNQNKIGKRKGSYDVGLWQINEFNWDSCSGGSAPCDPNVNLQCAIKLYKEARNTWKRWSTCGKCGCCNSS